MKVLVLNGSPRRERSNTLQLAKAFVDGFPEDWQTEFIHIYNRDIKPCLGCFSCWTKTPGKCVINDDMQEIYKKIESADIIIESFPLYFFGIPSGFKAVTDRCLPFMMPYLGTAAEDGKASFHELRNSALHEKRLILISTCGHISVSPMYPALLQQYDLICGEGNYTAVLCPEGEIFGYEGLAVRQRKAYLADVTKAGAEYAENFSLCEKTLESLAKPVLSASSFRMLTNSHWGEKSENK